MSSNNKWGYPLQYKIPVGALVWVKILERTEEYGIVLNTNYGFYENSWYLIYGLKSGKQYHAYPNEIFWIKKEEDNGTVK